MQYVYTIENDEKKGPKAGFKAKITLRVPLNHERMRNIAKIGGLNLKGITKDAKEAERKSWFSENSPILLDAYDICRGLIEKVEITGPKETDKADGLEAFETHPAFEMAFMELGGLYLGGFGPGKN